MSRGAAEACACGLRRRAAGAAALVFALAGPVAADPALHALAPSRNVPPLRAIAVGGDADNTRGACLAHLADLVLTP